MHVYCTVLSAGFRECLYRAVGFVCINCVCQIGSTVLQYMACLWSVVMLSVSLATRTVPVDTLLHIHNLFVSTVCVKLVAHCYNICRAYGQ